MATPEKCVVCGSIIPEGRMVCPICARGAAHPNQPQEKCFSGVKIKTASQVVVEQPHQCESSCE